MANERIYSIKINGVESSIDVIDKLLKRLEDLEKRIGALQGKTVSVGASGGGSSKGKASDLTAEERVSKKIQQTAERIAEARTDEYKALQQAKSDLKEIERQQKAVAAAQNLSGENAKEYANTLDGMRLKLSDMKRALGGIDISSPEFDKQVQEIDALNNKIKQIEQSYGQFGRNVGNYANGVAEGLQKVVIKVGETERTFNSAKEASRTLGNELKSMAVNGEDNTQAYKDLDEAFKKLESTMKDVSASSKMMDNLLDTMQGLTAIGSIGQGFSALFGFDNSEIQESIQKLVALQNILQGLETLQKQMTTEEGIGSIFKNASGNIDEFVAKLTGAKVGINGLEASSKSATIAVKGLSTAIKAVGIGVLIQLISQAVDQIKEFASEIKTGLKDAWNELIGGERYTAMEQLAAGIENINKKLEIRLQLINEDKSISEWGKQTETIYECNKALKEQLDLYLQLNKEGNSFFKNMAKNAGEFADNLLSNPTGSLGKLGLSTIKQVMESLNDWKAARKSNEELEQSVASLGNSVKKATRQVSADAEEMVNRWVEEINKCDIKTEEGKQKFQELARALDDDSVLNSVLLNLDRYIDSPETRAAIESMIARIRQLRGELSAPLGSIGSNISKYIESQEKWAKDIKKKHDEQVKKEQSAVKSGGAKVGETVQQQEEEITRLRIRAMDEGLQKVIAEINYNARKEIDALKLTGTRKAEAEALIEKERQRKVREAEAKDYQERIEARRNFNRQINQLEDANNQQRIENFEQDYQNFLEQRKNNIELQKELYDDDVALTPSYFKENPKFLEQLTTNLQLAEKERYEEILEARKKYYEDIFESETTWDEEIYKARLAHIQSLAELEKEEHEDELRKTWGDLDTVSNIMLLADEDISKAKELAKNKGGELGAAFASGKISIEEYQEKFDEFYADYLEKNRLLKEKTNNSLINLDIERVKEYSKAVKQEADSIVKDIDDIITGTERRYNSTKVTDVFGIVDLSASKKLTKETVAVYRDMQQRVQEMMDDLTEKFENGEISTEEYRDAIDKLILIYQKLNDKTKETEEKQADFGDFLRSIMPYVSQLANGFQNIMSQVSSLMSAEFEAQRQKLDDEIALLEEKYNEMEELEQRHADKINAIEDEISNARGARRDHLVDMYNEEIAAQRRAFIEKQKLDAEMRRKEEEQKALERAERKRQNQIQFQQAIVSQALAIMNAFATKPFVPVGLAMGALATTLTGVQLVLMKKAQQASERYADGGVIQGKSHAQGGVKVLGGKAEVEGGEYITNKRTTALNQPVLEYINSKHRKLTAADFIDFYNGKGNKTIKNNFKTKFASGGALPSVSASKANNIIVVKDESTPVVSVVDIINAEDNYNNVRVLAGVD